MADFWVGGTNTWNATAGTKWSLTDGGAGGAPVPTAVDAARFTALSGAATVTLGSNTNTCLDLDAANFTGSFVVTNALAVAGSFALNAGMSGYSGGGTITFTSTATGKTVKSAGKPITGNMVFNGVGGGWTLSDALSNSGTVTLTNGALNDGGFSLTASVFSSNNANVRAITKTAQWFITGTGTCANFTDPTNLTLTASGGWNFTNSSATARTFATGGQTFGGTVAVSAGTGTFNITGGPTFGGLDFTGFTGTWATGAITSTGDVTMGAGMTVTDTGTSLFLQSSGTQRLTSNGVQINRPVTQSVGGGTVLQQDALNLGARPWGVNAGTWRTQDHDLTASNNGSATGTTRAIYLGSSTVTLNGFDASNFVLNYGTGAGLTFDAGTSTIKITDASATAKKFNGAGQTFSTIWVAPGAGSGGVDFSGGAFTASVLKDDGSAAHTLTLGAGLTYSIGSWQVSGHAGQRISVVSSTPGTRATLTHTAAGNVTADYLSMQDCACGPGYQWFVGDHSTNNGNNAGVAFTTAANASSMMLAA